MSGIYLEKNEVNYTQTLYPNSIWIRKPTWEVAIKSAALIPIVLLGIIGNTVLLIAIIKNRSLKTPTNLLIMNMAVTDLATVVVSSWMFLVRDSFQNYVLGEFACNIEGFCEFAFLITGVFSLICISYNRLMAIVQVHEKYFTPKTAKICIAGTWIFGFIFALPLIIFRTYKERQWKNFLEIYCEEDKKVLPLYWNVIISLLIWIPLSIMFICYSAIFYKLDKYEKEVLKRINPISVKYKKKVAKTLFIMATVFIICRVPFTALIFWRSKLLQEKKPFTFGKNFTILWFTCHFLMFTNSTINPFIYGLTNESFRRVFRGLALNLYCCSKQKDKAMQSPRVLILQAKSTQKKFKSKCFIVQNVEVADSNLADGVFHTVIDELE